MPLRSGFPSEEELPEVSPTSAGPRRVGGQGQQGALAEPSSRCEATPKGGKWESPNTWTNGRVPTKYDIAYFTAASGNVTGEAGCECQSIEASTYTKTLSLSVGNFLIGGPSGNGTAMNIGASAVFKLGVNGGLKFVSTSGIVETITISPPLIENAQFIGNVFWESETGKWLLESPIKTTNFAEVVKGELSLGAGCANLYMGSLRIKVGGTMRFGSCVIQSGFRGLGGVCYENAGTVFTESSTLELLIGASPLNSPAEARMGGATYNNIVFLTGNITVKDSWTAANITFSKAAGWTGGIKVEEGVTITVTGSITPNSSPSQKLKLESTVSGKAWKLKCASQVVLKYVELKDCTAEGGTPFIAEASINNGGNTNWTFTVEAIPAAPPLQPPQLYSPSRVGAPFPLVEPDVLAQPAIIELNAAISTSSASIAVNAPTQVALEPALSTSSASAAINAPTEVPLSSASSTSSASLSLNAPTQIPLGSASSTSAASLDLHAPTQIPLGSASSTSSASLSLSAPTEIPLGTAASTSSASLSLTAPTLIALNAASSTSAASLTISAPTEIPLGSASSASSASLSVSAPTEVPLNAASSSSQASLDVSAGTQITLNAASSQSAASLDLTAPTLIALNSATSESKATLSLAAKTYIPLNSGSSISTASCQVETPEQGEPTEIPLNAALSTSAASLRLNAPTQITLNGALSASAASLSLTAPAKLTLQSASSTSAASLSLGTRAQILPAPCLSTSSATLALSAPTEIVLFPAKSISGAPLELSAPTEVPLNPAISTSSAANIVIGLPEQFLTASTTLSVLNSSPTAITVMDEVSTTATTDGATTIVSVLSEASTIQSVVNSAETEIEPT